MSVEIKFGLSFSEALEELKCGEKVAREGWNKETKKYSLSNRWEFIELQKHESEKIFVQTKDGWKFPINLVHEDILANDWYVVE